MTNTHPDASVNEIRYGQDPDLDAWLLHFMSENNLDYLLNPGLNASPEQLRFMVDLAEDQIFFPCPDDQFRLLRMPEMPVALRVRYDGKWKRFERLMKGVPVREFTRRTIMELARLRFEQALASHTVIPSRLMKRLVTVFLTLSGMEDPMRGIKRDCNDRAGALIGSDEFRAFLRTMPPDSGETTLQHLRRHLDAIELWRLLLAASWADDCESIPDRTHISDLAPQISSPEGDFQRAADILLSERSGEKTVLYLPSRSGGMLFDLLVCRFLLRQGHRVIMALKEEFYFQAATVWDLDHDPALAAGFEGSHVCLDDRMNKSGLLRTLREHRFMVISDGTREKLNLYRTSVTFARAWKEADVILAKGPHNYSRLIQSSHAFTRDILCFHHDTEGKFRLVCKPRPEHVRKFSEIDLTGKADEIIRRMREARTAGKTVMFYSAIVGSIPGETQTAIRVLSSFVEYLRSRLAGTFIINPAEHFEEGMDGDDLMYMWEIVQRSGLLNVWRFQSVADIEKSFELMGERVPPVWAGKDSTYSTGCTQEMRIALDMQQRHPELQIIGPSPEKFMRRREYGVGKYCDAGIDCH